MLLESSNQQILCEALRSSSATKYPMESFSVHNEIAFILECYPPESMYFAAFVCSPRRFSQTAPYNTDSYPRTASDASGSAKLPTQIYHPFSFEIISPFKSLSVFFLW